jgi:LacI family transcriptional regulator
MEKDKEITIYDLAKSLNISASTVSRALSNHPSIHKKTKQNVAQMAKEMGYQQNNYASGLRLKRTNTIGVIVPRLDSYFMANVICGLEKELNKNGYNLIISQSQESAIKEINGVSTFFSNRVDGLIISLSSETTHIKHLDVFLKNNIPVVFFDRVAHQKKCSSVIIDNFDAGYKLTSHLIDQGCKKIFHFTGNLKCSVYSERFAGYKKAIKDKGLDFEKYMVFSNGLDKQSVTNFLTQIMNKDLKMDGIFATNDNSAAEIISGLKSMGYQVPNDIAVVGFNNNPVSEIIDPNITSIDYPGVEMGEIAAATIVKQINNKDTGPKKIIISHELIIRASSKKITPET